MLILFQEINLLEEVGGREAVYGALHQPGCGSKNLSKDANRLPSNKWKVLYKTASIVFFAQ